MDASMRWHDEVWGRGCVGWQIPARGRDDKKRIGLKEPRVEPEDDVFYKADVGLFGADVDDDGAVAVNDDGGEAAGFGVVEA